MRRIVYLLILCIILFAGTLKGQTYLSVHNYYFYYNNQIYEPTITLFTSTPLGEKTAFSSYALTRPSWSQILLGINYQPAKWITAGLKIGLQSAQNGNMWRYSPMLILNKKNFSFFGVYEWGGIKDRSQIMANYRVKSFKPGIMMVQSLKFVAIGPMLEYQLPKWPFAVYASAMLSLSDNKFASQFGIYYRLKPKLPQQIKPIIKKNQIHQIDTPEFKAVEPIVQSTPKDTFSNTSSAVKPRIKIAESTSETGNTKRNNYYVIIASFKEKTNAINYINNFAIDEIQLHGAYSKSRGYFYVVAGKYDSYAAAIEHKKQLYKDFKLNSWILEK